MSSRGNDPQDAVERNKAIDGEDNASIPEHSEKIPDRSMPPFFEGERHNLADHCCDCENETNLVEKDLGLVPACVASGNACPWILDPRHEKHGH